MASEKFVIFSVPLNVLLAARSGMDAAGLFAVAFAAAFGGGTLRDLFLDRHPLFWIERAEYPVVVFGIAVVASVLPRLVVALERHLLIPDAVGMALFVMAGTEIAREAEVSPFLAILFGVITGTFGGVIAEVICNRIPTTFQPGTPLNASCCFVGAGLYIIAVGLGMPATFALVAGFVFIVAARLAAVRWKWAFPAVGVS